MQIGLLGGTGIEGKGLAMRFALAGAAVLIGSRMPGRAQAAAGECNQALGKPLVHGATNHEMLAAAEMVFLTVPFHKALDAVTAYRDHFMSGTILVDVTVPMRFVEGQPEYTQPEAGSGAELLARHLPPGVDLVVAFKEIPAHALAQIEIPLDCDVLVCGDSRKAREKVIAAAGIIPSLRPLDAGPLSMAATVERMTVLAVRLNRRYKQRGARFRVLGI